VLDLHKLTPEQHFTQPPPRYSEASLIKELEEQGIGRPSTYVPIISTIQDRGYVDQEQRRFVATWLGETVNEVMNKHFPDIVDTGFTAEMERKLDYVEEGRQSWIEFLRSFYGDFKVTMEKAEAEMNRVQKPVETIDELCPECGRNLVIRTGRFGRFISCSGFPECRYRRSVVNKTGALCPICQGDLVERKTKQKKRIFYGCNNYPTCNFAIWEKPVPELCPDCGGLMIVPRAGQNPVCYREFVDQQGVAVERPEQNGTSSRRSIRKKVTTTEETSLLSQTPVKNGKSSTIAKKTTTRTTRGRTKKATAASRTKSSGRGKKATPGIKRATTKKAHTS